MNNPPSTEERVWAALSHLSALGFGVGLLLPVIGWSQQRDKSKYAAFQCLQALGYQSLGYTVWFLGYAVLMIILFLVVLVILSLVTARTGELEPVAMAGFNILLFLFVFLGIGLYFLLPVIAAISCALGRDFRYPVMGSRLARYLGYDLTATSNEPLQLNEEHEDRWVTAMGHFAVIIPLWGILAPVMAWATQGRRSPLVKLQSAQTVIYQTFVALLSFLPGMIYLLGFVAFLLSMGLSSVAGNNSPVVGGGVILLLVFGFLAVLTALLLPLLHILGQWAGYRVLKGDDYRYPLVGRAAEGWFMKKTVGETEAPPVVNNGAERGET